MTTKDRINQIRRDQQLNDAWVAEFIYMAVNIRADGEKYTEMLEDVIRLAKKRYAKEVDKQCAVTAVMISAPKTIKGEA